MASPTPLPSVNPTTGATDVYTAQPTGKGEPVLIAAAISAAVVQIVGLAVVFGADISDEQQKAILGAVEPTVIMLFVLGGIVRQYVTPVWKAKALIDAAHQAGTVGADKPQL